MFDHRPALSFSLAPALVSALTLLALACQPVGAETNPWYVGVSQGLTYESNLYRVDTTTDLNNGRDPTQPPVSRSDTVSVTSLVGGIDQPIGRQRLFGNLSLRNNRYLNNGDLNGTSYSLTAGLDWSTIERFSGNVNLSASQNQRRFNIDTVQNGVETLKNNESIEQIDAVARAGVVTRLTLEAGVGYRQVGYSAAAYANSEYDQTSGSLGVRYRPGIATFGAAYRRAQSNYKVTAITQVNDNTRDSLDLTVSWPVSGASSLYLRLSPTQVRYDNFTERDFSGMTGALSWDWMPTGKVKVGTRLVYDIGQDSAFERFGIPGTNATIPGTSSTARTTTNFRVTADYEASAKVALTTGLGVAHRSLEKSSNIAGQPANTGSGNDNTTTLSLGARWTPLRSVTAGCDLGYDKRSVNGNLERQEYSANTVSCYGQFTLQ